MSNKKIKFTVVHNSVEIVLKREFSGPKVCHGLLASWSNQLARESQMFLVLTFCNYSIFHILNNNWVREEKGGLTKST